MDPVMCVFQREGTKVRYIGLFNDPNCSPDPDDQIRAIANRNGGFGIYSDWEALKPVLEQNGWTNLIGKIEEALQEARFGNPGRHKRAASKPELLRQLKRAMGVTASI